jgi:hypothetical protein
MKNLDDRTMANLDVALEEACRNLPHGGMRKRVAQKLLSTARKGNTTLSGLSAVAQNAVLEVTERKSA